MHRRCTLSHVCLVQCYAVAMQWHMHAVVTVCSGHAVPHISCLVQARL